MSPVPRPRLVLLTIALGASVALTAPSASAQTTPSSDQPATEQPPSTVLFVQSAARGALIPNPGNPDQFVLTLAGVAPSTLWFTDRPVRRSGNVPTQGAIDRIGFDDDVAAGPPNAVLSLRDGKEAHDLLALTLREPRYDADQGTLRYSATRLATDNVGSLPVAPEQLDTSLPRRFASAALFIDDVPNDGSGCEVYISFKGPAGTPPVNFTRIQDFIDSPGPPWIGIPHAGDIIPVNKPSGSGVGLYNRSPGAGPWDKYLCRGGIVFGLQPGGTEFFLYFNNPQYSSSDWGCTVPAG